MLTARKLCTTSPRSVLPARATAGCDRIVDSAGRVRPPGRTAPMRSRLR